MNEKRIWQCCIIGIAVGMVILFYGLFVWVNADAQTKWPVAQARIVSSQAKATGSYGRRSHNRNYTSIVEYSYQASGQSYQGTQRCSGWRFSDNHKTGSVSPVHYNPANPSNSILKPRVFEGQSYSWIGFVLCVLFPIAATVLSR